MHDLPLTPRVWALRCLVAKYGSVERAFIEAHAEHGCPDGAACARHDYREMFLEKRLIPSYIVAHYNALYPWNSLEKEFQIPRVYLLAAE